MKECKLIRANFNRTEQTHVSQLDLELFASEDRVRIMVHLCRVSFPPSQTISELKLRFGLSTPILREHLRPLERAGYVSTELLLRQTDRSPKVVATDLGKAAFKKYVSRFRVIRDAYRLEDE